MKVLVTYDVNTASEHGARRLRQVAKACQNYGLRVQNSVFECVLDEAKFVVLRNELISIIDSDNDSVRFYFLGNNWQKRVETIGFALIQDVEKDTFIL